MQQISSYMFLNSSLISLFLFSFNVNPGRYLEFSLPILGVAVVSLDVCSNVLALLTPILDSSFTLSFACCIEVLNASMLANIMLFTNLVAAIILSAKLLTIFAYISVKCLGDIQFDVNTLFASSICGTHADCSELIICLCDSI